VISNMGVDYLDAFVLLGDIFHIASILILFVKIYSHKNCRGISLKSQILYAIVFIVRYLDLFTDFLSVYDFSCKALFIVSSCTIVYLMSFKKPYCDTYDAQLDAFPIFAVLIPCAVLSLIVARPYLLTQIAYIFSVYLEAVAIVPQLIVVHRTAIRDQGFVENLTSHYVFALGGYRTLYLMSFIYRILTIPNYRFWNLWIAGTIQTIIYCDFFYYYLKARVTGDPLLLPL